MDNLDFSYEQLSNCGLPNHETALMEVLSSDTRDALVYLDYHLLKNGFPHLAAEFQDDDRGGANFILLTKSVSTGISLGRHITTATYYIPNHDDMYDLLVHVELYYLAVKYHMTQLQEQAKMQMDISIPTTGIIQQLPYNLFPSISLIYEHEPLLDDLKGRFLLFCITRFKGHLQQNVDFVELLQKSPRIVIDLCATSFQRDFQDDCAGDLIRLPSSNENMTEDQIEFSNFLQRLFHEVPMDAARRRAPPDSSYGVVEASDAEESAVEELDGLAGDFVVLSLRPRNLVGSDGEAEESEEEFVIVM